LRGHDPYLVCADFGRLRRRRGARRRRLPRPARLVSPRLYNIVGGASFSSDQTIQRYADEIWHIRPVKTDLASIGDS